MELLSLIMPLLLQGVIVTLQLAFGGSVLAFFVAFVAGLARLSPLGIVRAVVGLYVEVFRGTSLIVQLFWVFFVLPFIGINLSPLAAGTLALGLNAGAYGSEIVRGAILGVPKGQTEAAIALNMSGWQRTRLIVLPQALIRMLPPMGNLSVEIVKGTALASLITLSDLTFQAHKLIQSIGHTAEIFTVILIIYFLLAYPLTRVIRWVERQLPATS